MKPDKVSKERQRELDEDLWYQRSGLSPEFGAETARNLRKDRLKREAKEEAERCSMKLNATWTVIGCALFTDPVSITSTGGSGAPGYATGSTSCGGCRVAL
jgi:hypothetical protein